MQYVYAQTICVAFGKAFLSFNLIPLIIGMFLRHVLFFLPRPPPQDMYFYKNLKK